MIKVKDGVTPRNLYIAAAIANAAWDLPYDITITSGTDGQHMVGSKHYLGAALDIRTSNFPAKKDIEFFIQRLQTRLGKDYQVILEADHIHAEHDPKT